MFRQLKFVSAVLALGMFSSVTTANAATISVATPLSSTNSASAESTLGDLTADSVLSAAPSAQIALVPAEELLSRTYPAGSVDSDDLTSYLKGSSDQSDTVVTLNLTGSELFDALNHGASRLSSPFDGFLQVAGIKVRFHHASDGTVAVESAVLSSGAALNQSSHYVVAMPKTLADGALGYFAVWGPDSAPTGTGVSMKDAVARYAASHQPLSYSAGSRITGE